MCALLTKREVKIHCSWIFAKYFCVFLWTKMKSRKKKYAKKNEVNIQPS